jgi:putative ABC transport system permease protein
LSGPGSSVDDQRVGAYYFPYNQAADSRMTIAIRTAGDSTSMVGAVRREIAALDPELPFYRVRTMEDIMSESLTSRRTPTMLAVAFGVVALFLATIGIYGVLAYQVTQRRREMGIRIALGSDAAGIFGLILREGATLLVIGFAAGLAGAFALRGTISAQLYDVQPMDPLVVTAMAAILALVGLLACAIPARRAAKIDPLIALTDQ